MVHVKRGRALAMKIGKLVGVAILVGCIGMGGCSWEDAAIGVPIAAAALVGPKLVTDRMYGVGQMAGLRAGCKGSADWTSVECQEWRVEFQNCMGHLGLFATDASRRNCAGG